MNITLMQHTRCATVKKLEHRVQYELSYLGVSIWIAISKDFKQFIRITKVQCFCLLL